MEVSTIYKLDLQSYTRFRRNLVFGANLIVVYIYILQSLLYLTFTAFGLQCCYTASVVGYRRFVTAYRSDLW